MHTQPITDVKELQKFKEVVLGLMDGPWDFQVDRVAAKGWWAIPVESSAHFSKEEAQRLAIAIRHLGCSECLAVATEPLAQHPEGFKLSPTPEALLAFSQECGLFNFMLFEPGLHFAILCTTEDYFVVAGPKGFAEEALGLSVEVAREQFERFASHWPEGKNWGALRNMLKAVSKRYASLPPRS